MIMTGGLCVAANILFYLGYRNLKMKKSKAKKREYDIAYNRFYTKT